LKKFQIKILGQGNLTKPLIFDYRLLFSEKAKEKIENSGSKIQ
jgi:ribosomal protein L15